MSVRRLRVQLDGIVVAVVDCNTSYDPCSTTGSCTNRVYNRAPFAERLIICYTNSIRGETESRESVCERERERESGRKKDKTYCFPSNVFPPPESYPKECPAGSG